MEIAAYIVIVALVLQYSLLGSRIQKIQRRADRVERKLDLILGHLDIQVAEPGLERVAALVREGKKIEAIKVYRQLTDADLKEAKEAVERMEVA
ncbi:MULTISPECIES: ribosomal protein L7/L12 [unclassified Streptomyces]|uniref:ribosomal protein L7/L12 n=1 Tax=unclassified Streptomyces TaxID=2593676 RepID=UPI00168BC9FC|nr:MULTISPECIES: ribosomal protein L7/L12 [unclassified Streptomyces]MBD3006224.1 ribosomal protein L7/L12 [Streptomyces sp. 5-10]